MPIGDVERNARFIDQRKIDFPPGDRLQFDATGPVKLCGPNFESLTRHLSRRLGLRDTCKKLPLVKRSKRLSLGDRVVEVDMKPGNLSRKLRAYFNRGHRLQRSRSTNRAADMAD